MAEDAGEPLMDSMIKQGVLNKDLFSFYLGLNENESSELTFGSYDPKKFHGDLSWHPVVDKLFWSLELEDILYDGESLGICGGRKTNGAERDCIVTPDSGTSFSTIPKWALKSFKSKIPYKTKDCKSDEQFGDLTYVIDG